MRDALSELWRRPALRLVALVVMGVGSINASLFPYQSLVAVQRVGLSEAAFALVLIVAAVAGVTAAMTIGIVTDRRARRRAAALLTGGAALAGPVAMWLAPSPVTLILCHGLLLPSSGAL